MSTIRTEVAAATAPARIRRRALAVQPEPVQPVATPVIDEAVLGPDPVIAQMQAHLKDFVIANTLKNAADRAAAKAKKALHAVMSQAGYKACPSMQVEMDGVKVTAEAKIEASESEKIDVAKLRTLVDEATFMKIIAATKTAVVAHAGHNIAVASTVTVTAPEDLRIVVQKP